MATYPTKLCMCICICVYVYVYMCTCVYVYMCMCICVYVYMCMCICVYVYVYMCICVYVFYRNREPAVRSALASDEVVVQVIQLVSMECRRIHAYFCNSLYLRESRPNNLLL